jgi:hypothetical protein
VICIAGPAYVWKRREAAIRRPLSERPVVG